MSDEIIPDVRGVCGQILTKIAEQGVTLETINTQVGKLQDEISVLKAEVTAVNVRVIETEGSARAAQDKAADAQEKILNIQSKIDRLEERADSLHTEIVKAKAQVPDGLIAGFAVMQSDLKRITNMGYLIGSTVVVLIIKAIVPMIGA